jgi:O-antigen/teichoic acid export membrane protein
MTDGTVTSPGAPRAGRLGRTLAAHGYGQAITLFVQIVSIPLFIAAWDLQTFGVWLLVSALPMWLAFADLGFTFIAKNDMAVRAASGDRHGALVTFQSVLALLLFTLALGVAAIASVLWLVRFEHWFDFATVSAAEVRLAIGALALSTLIQQVFLLLCAGLRAAGQPASEAAWAATARLIEASAAVTAALAGGGIAAAALAWLVARLVATIALGLRLRRITPWLPFGIAHASRRRLAELSKPALSYTLIPAGNALLIHGPVIILGAVAGPASVALFSVTRTVARLGMAGANMLAYAFTPEYSYAHGGRDPASLQHHLQLHAMLLIAGLALYLLVMTLLLPWGIGFVSRGTIIADRALTTLLVLAVCLESLWTGALTPIAARNAHPCIAIAFAPVALAALLAATQHASSVSFATGIAAAHAVMLAVTGIAFARLLRDVQNAAERQ